MSIKKLALMAPGLCDARNAHRYGKIAEMVFNYEMNNKDSVFAENPIDKEDPYNRIAPVFSWRAGIGYESKKRYIMDLVVFSMKMHYLKEHDDKSLEAETYILRKDLESREPMHPDVKAIQPVAGIMGIWA